MNKARYYRKLHGVVQCMLCPHICKIAPDKAGLCRVRRNIGGELYSLSYGNPVSLAADPVEKKPLFHFMPGSTALSYGTVGCNLSCKQCQNFEISQASPKEIPTRIMRPQDVVKLATDEGCAAIAYTYNEPTVFFEHMMDCCSAARKAGLRNILVSNGYINPEPLEELCGVLDAANIDLKSFSEEFYASTCGGHLAPVLASLKHLSSRGIWLEVTNLLIPSLNDSPEETEKLAQWVSDSLGRHVPLHISRFHPDYQLRSTPMTPCDNLTRAAGIARRHLDFVYVGNLPGNSGENTNCVACGATLVERSGFRIIKNAIENGKCPRCGSEIPGVWS